MSLWIHNNCFTWDEVKLNGASLAKRFEEEQYRHSLLFCYDWLNNKDVFSFMTSGSTGAPKTISITQHQMQASARSTIDALGLGDKEHILVCLNTRTIAGVMMLVRGMLLACEVTVREPSSNPLGELSNQHPYTFASFVPMQLSDMVYDPLVQEKVNAFKHILVGGAAIPSSLEKALEQSSAKIYHTYGMTETVSHVALKRIGKDPSFRILPGIETKTDERGGYPL